MIDSHADSAAATRHADGSWTLANGALALRVEAATGRCALSRPGWEAERAIPFEPFVAVVDGAPIPAEHFVVAEIAAAEGSEWAELRVTLRCQEPQIRAAVTLRLYHEGGPLRWQTSVGAANGAAVELSALRSLRLRLPPDGWRWRTLTGGRRQFFGGGFPPPNFRWRETALGPGAAAQIASGLEGRSSVESLPWFALAAPDGSGCYAGLEWSGHWLATATGDEDGSEITAGMAGVRRRVSGDTTLASAWMFLGAYGGFDGAANAGNRWLQRALCPPVPADFPWVFYNSWDAYHADIDEPLLRREAERAAALGVEVFVIDDGWFRGRQRRERGAGWGDWHADPARFPGGLERFADDIRRLGMRFGIWVEPEQVDRRGALARAHPDWFLTIDGREVRAQSGAEVSAHLCLGNPAVVEWLKQDLARMVRQYGVAWIKWDYNLGYGPGCDAPHHGHQAGDGTYAYVQGLYAVLGYLREQFPDLVLQNCASGGNRIDYGLLRFFHTQWLADSTQRAAVVRSHVAGAGVALPARYLNTAVAPERAMGGVGGRSIGRVSAGPMPTEADFRSRMGGAFGFSAPLVEWDEATLRLARAKVAEYKALRPLLRGDRYLLRPPAPDLAAWDAWQFVDERRERSAILAFNGESPERTAQILPKGLDPDATYAVRSDGVDATRATGRALAAAGLTVLLDAPNESAVIWLERRPASTE